MTLQNRIDPFGRLVAVAERGTLTGNRGVIHNDQRQIVRAWRVRRWIACRLEYKGARRQVMRPGRWTELFFADEATSLAAGHRPCFYCRRPDALKYQEAWVEAGTVGDRPAAGQMDDLLHSARLGDRPIRPIADLPTGTMVAVRERALLVTRTGLLGWSPRGYRPVDGPHPHRAVVLTPEPTVAALAAGYRIADLHSCV